MKRLLLIAVPIVAVIISILMFGQPDGDNENRSLIPPEDVESYSVVVQATRFDGDPIDPDLTEELINLILERIE